MRASLDEEACKIDTPNPCQSSVRSLATAANRLKAIHIERREYPGIIHRTIESNRILSIVDFNLLPNRLSQFATSSNHLTIEIRVDLGHQTWMNRIVVTL